MLSPAILSTLLSLLGLIIGGLIGKFGAIVFPKKINHLLALCGGILLGLLGLELIPDALAQYNRLGLLLGFGLGLAIVLLVENFIHEQSKKRKIIGRSSLFLVVAIALHNIPMGLAIGANFSSVSTSLTSTLFMVVFFHLLPEGMALIYPFMIENYHMYNYLFASLLLSLILGIGTKIGIQVGEGVQRLNPLFIGAAIGSIGYVTLHEIIWKAKTNLRWSEFILFTFTGIMLIKLYLLLI